MMNHSSVRGCNILEHAKWSHLSFRVETASKTFIGVKGKGRRLLWTLFGKEMWASLSGFRRMRQRGGKSCPASGADFVGQFEVPPLGHVGGTDAGAVSWEPRGGDVVYEGQVASRRRRGRRINGVASHGGGEPQGREEGRSEPTGLQAAAAGGYATCVDMNWTGSRAFS